MAMKLDNYLRSKQDEEKAAREEYNKAKERLAAARANAKKEREEKRVLGSHQRRVLQALRFVRDGEALDGDMRLVLWGRAFDALQPIIAELQKEYGFQFEAAKPRKKKAVAVPADTEDEEED